VSTYLKIKESKLRHNAIAHDFIEGGVKLVMARGGYKSRHGATDAIKSAIGWDKNRRFQVAKLSRDERQALVEEVKPVGLPLEEKVDTSPATYSDLMDVIHEILPEIRNIVRSEVRGALYTPQDTAQTSWWARLFQ